MTTISRILSTLLHPLWMPFYAFLMLFHFTYLSMTGDDLKIILLGIVAFFTLILPFVLMLALRFLGVITSISLHQRKERNLPYIIMILCYISTIMVLRIMWVPTWILGLLAGAVMALVLTLIINMHWKISAHLTGMGGFMAGLLIVSAQLQLTPIYLIMLGIILSGMLGVARIHLQRHSASQVYWGFLNGFGSMYLAVFLIQILKSLRLL